MNQDKQIMCNAFEGVTASKTIDFGRSVDCHDLI